MSFGSKGNIRFVYDAAGNKLQKIITDKTQAPNIVTTTDYVDGFIYQHIGSTAYDTLQFFPTEEGRVRYVPAHGSTAAAYVYDYFIKDHLGNTRVVLTEQTDFSQYLATMPACRSLRTFGGRRQGTTGGTERRSPLLQPG